MRFLILLLPVLGAAPVLKIGDVQAVEVCQALWLALAAPLFLFRGMPVPASGPWRRYGTGYLAFLLLALVLAGVSLRLAFFTPPDSGSLKQPGVLSVARLLELSLAILFMLVVAGKRSLTVAPRLRHSAPDRGATARERFPQMIRLYVWTGELSAVLSILGWILKKALSISTPIVYGYEDRVRGFFNEGGPYGLYLVSVGLIVLLRTRFRTWLLLPLAAALLLSGSKAGLLAVLCLALAAAAVTGSRRWQIAILGASVLVIVLFAGLFQGKIFGYFWSYLNFEEALAYRPGDPSLIMGRIAASLIVPRMIGAHPWLGIGAGNYSLMRNDPEYLQGLPPVDDWDLPGMGLFGSAAEFGIPLTVFLLLLLLRPFLRARREKAPTSLAVLAAFPAIAFLLGVNLNFFYPWLLAGLAMGAESC